MEQDQFVTLVGVKSPIGGKVDYFEAAGFALETGDAIIVQPPGGLELVHVVIPRRQVPERQAPRPLWPVVRAATEEDLAIRSTQEDEEMEALRTCRQKVREHDLPMKLLATHYAFDKSTLTFYFAAAGRVDFRRLVKELATIFKVRIEMHQVGPRDEARLFSGLGPCGQPLCCVRFLSVFEPVSIKMAKDQGVSLTPGKISGACGRLQCCLRFEHGFYRDEKKRMPKVGTKFEAEGRPCRVVDCNFLTGKVAIEKEGSGRCWLSREEALALCSRKES